MFNNNKNLENARRTDCSNVSGEANQISLTPFRVPNPEGTKTMFSNNDQEISLSFTSDHVGFSLLEMVHEILEDF